MNEAVIETMPPPPALSTPLTPMAMISQAVQGGASIELLERLMALQERWEASEAKREFDEALSLAKTEITPIIKNRSASYGQGKAQYEYEDLAAIAEVVDPILAKCGLSYRYRS